MLHKLIVAGQKYATKAGMAFVLGTGANQPQPPIEAECEFA